METSSSQHSMPEPSEAGLPPLPITPPQHPQPLVTPPAKPRVWPALVIVPMTLVAILIGQIVLGIAFAVYHVAIGGDAADIAAQLMTSPLFLTLSLLLNFTVICGAAVAGGILSRESIIARLSLGRPSALWTLPLVFVGTWFVWGLVMMAMPKLFDTPSDHLIGVQQMLASMARTSPLLLILLIAVMPAIVEELLCRGYVQRRLTQRLGPLVGLLLATIGFGILHMDPQHVVGVLPLGLWFGFVAWRTGSVYPAMLCHASNNGLAVAIILLNPEFLEAMETPIEATATSESAWDALPFAMLPFMTITGVFFVAAVVSLMVFSRPADAAAPETASPPSTPDLRP